MNLATIRVDLKARLATIGGLTTYDTVPAKPEVPCAIVQPVSGVVHSVFERGSSDVRFSIVVLVQQADWPSAQAALDGYITTVVDAIESPTTGTEDVTVETWDGYGTASHGENLYATVTFNVLAMVDA